MSWIAMASRDAGVFDPAGLQIGARFATQAQQSGGQDVGNALLPRGSLMVETRISSNGRPQRLLSLRRSHPWEAQISLQAIPGDGIALVLSQGKDVFHKVLQHNAEARTDVLRITYSWDAPSRWGRLAIERPESETVISAVTPPPQPLMLEDIRVLVHRPQLRQMDEDMLYFAVSNDIEPLGPMPSLASDVPIATPFGYRNVGALKIGDTVQTRDAGIVPVLGVVKRTVPAHGSFRPVRLRAPYFGLVRDIVVAPEQRLVIEGSDVEYMFGKEAVLVPARHLVNGVSAVNETGHGLVEYTQLILPGHQALTCAGTSLESLFVGRLRRKPELLAQTVLAGFNRSRLPEHARASYPVLKPFEAITLAQNRAA